MSLIKRAREDATNHPALAKTTHCDMTSWIKEQRRTEYPALEPLVLAIVIDFAANGDFHQVASEHNISQQSLREMLRLPLASDALSYYRATYTDAKLVNAAYIESQRVRALHMALGDEDVFKIDKDGHQSEGKETNLTAARGILNDLEKSESLLDGSTPLGSAPIINVINHGTVNMNGSQEKPIQSSADFLSRFTDRTDSVDVDTCTDVSTLGGTL